MVSELGAWTNIRENHEARRNFEIKDPLKADLESASLRTPEA